MNLIEKKTPLLVKTDYRDYRTGTYVNVDGHKFRVNAYGTLEYIPVNVWVDLL